MALETVSPGPPTSYKLHWGRNLPIHDDGSVLADRDPEGDRVGPDDTRWATVYTLCGVAAVGWFRVKPAHRAAYMPCKRCLRLR